MRKFYSILLIPSLIAFGAMIFLIGYRQEQKTQSAHVVKTSLGVLAQENNKNRPQRAEELKPYSLVPSYQQVPWHGQAPIKKGKVIEIVLSSQRFLTWQDGVLLGNFITSTGKPASPTKTGHFKILDHYRYATGGTRWEKWGLPYFMGIYFVGPLENGIHELPFVNGKRVSASDFGHPVSHGCPRLQIGIASVIYKWADNGTPVIIHD